MNERRELVHPARLDWGILPGSKSGDIHESYSADRIGERKPIREPFTWNGSRWCCVGMCADECEAYQLTPVALFKGVRMTYAERSNLRMEGREYDGDGARYDPNGFYHGIEVKYKGQAFILDGPPVLFAAAQDAKAEPEQLDLFAA